MHKPLRTVLSYVRKERLPPGWTLVSIGDVLLSTRYGMHCLGCPPSRTISSTRSTWRPSLEQPRRPPRFSPYRALVLIVLNRTTTKVGVRGIVASKNRPLIPMPRINLVLVRDERREEKIWYFTAIIL